MRSDISVKTVAISLTLTKFLVPNKKKGFGPFSYKFFVPIRVGLIHLKLLARVRFSWGGEGVLSKHCGTVLYY